MDKAQIEQLAPGRSAHCAEIKTGRRPKRPVERYFFVAMGIFAIFIALIPFGPVLLKVVSGSFPLAWVLHVHGALMTAWLAMFFAQTVFAATGRMALHRRAGRFGIPLGFAVWASMVAVEMRAVIVHPRPDLSSYDDLLPGVYIYSLFLLCFTSAVYLRKLPAWHKRLMVVTAFLTLQAAFMRIYLPIFAPGYWNDALYLDGALFIPLVAYDFISIKRLHPATILSAALLLSAQTALSLAWGTEGWRNFAFHFSQLLRSLFLPG